jgi:hypothetical protein
VSLAHLAAHDSAIEEEDRRPRTVLAGIGDGARAERLG